VGGGVGEDRLLGFEGDVLARVREPGGLDLVDLEPQQIELAGTRPVVPAERGELGLQPALVRPRGAVGRKRLRRGRAGEAIERSALHRRRQQRLVRALPVEVDEGGAALGELAHRG
jgi:hypothetical protein